MRFIFSFLVFLITSSLLTGCLDEEFTSNPNDRLTFSADTVRFDTVFTTIGSSTTQFMIYNTHKRAINIESIELKNAGNSGFGINVDGMKGTRFEQVEISRKDSLYIFIEVKVNPTNQDEPVRTEDILELNYNGIRQQIILEAYGQDAIIWRGKVIGQDTVLSKTKPFLIYDSLHINPGCRLTLEAGTRLFMHDKARIRVEGGLTANGEIGNPVILRGNRTDKLFHNLAYDQMAGQWGGIEIGPESFENKLTHTNIRGTSFGLRIDSTNTDREKIRLESCILKNSKAELLKAVNARIEAANCEFSNAGGALIYLQGGNYRFTHCTIANLYPFGVISESALYLSNYMRDPKGNAVPLSLERAEFNNCIIWGKRSVEVNLDEYQKAGNDPVNFSHLFDHCLIKAKGEDDENFLNSIWDKNPEFKAVNEKEYLFDFRPDSVSPVRNAGNPAFANEFPLDLMNNLRTPDAVDLGAYQWIGE
ncbi:MAG: hypothetical protein RR346_02900 [Bacteroidales bacterium]